MRRYIAIFLVCLLLLQAPGQLLANTIIDYVRDFGEITSGAPTSISGVNTRVYRGIGNAPFKYSRDWRIRVVNDKGVLQGSGLTPCIVDKNYLEFNFVPTSQLSQWVSLLNGDLSFVQSRMSNPTLSADLGSNTIMINGRSSNRIWIRVLAELCGATPTVSSNWIAEVQTTPYPTALIGYDYSAKVGGQANFTLTAAGFAASGYLVGGPGLNQVTFKVNGSTVASYNNVTRIDNAQASWTVPAEGIYKAELSATDKVGRRTTKTLSFAVGDLPQPPQEPQPTPVKRPPVAKFEVPVMARPGEVINVNDLSYDPDGTIIHWAWTVTPNEDAEINLSTSGSGGTLSFLENGLKEIRLKVTDNDSMTDETVQFVLVVGPPPAPAIQANFSLPGYMLTGFAVPVEDLSTSRGTITKREWEIWPMDGVDADMKTDGSTSTITFMQPGTFSVKLTIWDSNNLTDSLTKTIEIIQGNKPPTANFSMPEHQKVGTAVPVTDNSYDDDGYIVKWEWELTPADGGTLNLSGTDDSGGDIRFTKTGEHELKLTVTDNNGAAGSATKSILIVENQPPVARIDAPERVLQARDVEIRSASYDPDGTIANHAWTVTPDDSLMGILDGETSTVYFDKLGTHTIELTVTDDDGLTATTTKEIEVEPAIPQAYFSIDGTYKVNRRLDLNAVGSSTVPHSPILWEETIWEYLPAEGQDEESCKVRSSGDLQKRALLFKEPGDWKIRLKVKNEAGHYSEWFEQTIKIYPDEAPIVDFMLPVLLVRDVTNNRKAIIQPQDTSQVIDGDRIKERVWKYQYDSNNDGSFEDETWITFSAGNDTMPKITNGDVGRYRFELEVVEEFGQPTLEEFIGPEDILRSSTSWKPAEEKIAEVINNEPSVSFRPIKIKKPDIAIVMDQLDSNKMQELRSLISSSLGSEIKPNITFYERYSTTAKTSFSWEVRTYRQNGFGNGDGQFQQSGNNYTYRGFGRTAVPGWGSERAEANDESLKNAPADHLYVRDSSTNTQEFTFDVDLTGYNVRAETIPALLFNAGYSSTMYYGLGSMLLINPTKIQVYSLFNMNDLQGLMYHHAGDLIKGNGTEDFWWRQLEPGGGSAVYFNRQVRLREEVTVPYSLQKSIKVVHAAGSYKIYVNNNLVLEGEGATTGTASSGFPSNYGIAAVNRAHRHLAEDGRRNTFQINNFALKETVNKDFRALVEGVTWGDTPSRFLINLTEQPMTYKREDVAVTRSLLNNNVHYLALWHSGRETLLDTLLGRGKLLNTQPNTVNLANEIAQYVKTALANEPVGLEEYILLNEEIKYETYYNDPEQDPEIARKWLYDHNSHYFENSLGLVSYHKTELDNQVTAFNRVGKFNVNFRAQDEPKPDPRFENYRKWSYMPTETLDIYVHRRPAAYFTAATEYDRPSRKYLVTIENQSYDRDHSSKANKGIVKEEWKWKGVNDSAWTEGKLLGPLDSYTNYYVYLRVQDEEGIWSLPYVDLVSTSAIRRPPIAQFTVTPFSQIIGRAFSIEDQSYSPNGYRIEEWVWRLQKPDGQWVNYGATKPEDLSKYGTGLYTIELKVRDAGVGWQGIMPEWSLPVQEQAVVITENLAPTVSFTISPNPVAVDEPYQLNINRWDPEGDPIVEEEWQVYRPGAGSWQPLTGGWKSTYEAMGLEAEGAYQFRVRIKDDPTGRNAYLVGKWSNWYSQTVQVESTLAIIGESEQDVYAAGQAMLINAHTEGRASRVEAEMWYPRNHLVNTGKTDLLPDQPLGSPAAKEMNWHSGRTKAEGRDNVVIIPLDTPEGTYTVKLTAYKPKVGGGYKMETDFITVKVKGNVYDHSHSQIIG